MFPVGVELTVKLIPDSGYQLTEFTLNGTPFEPGEEVGVYTFTTIGGNFHLGAHFTEVNNEVETDSKKVKSGNIEIKTNNDAFSNGTAKLEINDIENLPEDRTSAFTETASNEGYRIDDYLDMSLYNTIYKGGLKDVSGRYESWDTSIEKIDDDASITLELEENMEGKDIVVLHEIHDGDTVTGYEILDAKYDKENNAITFETDSFSNYAIASRESTAKTYTVTLEKNNGEEAEKCNVNENEKIEEPKEPSKEGFKFEGWYKDKELTERFDFEDEIKEDITLYAKWIEEQSKEMELKSGTYIAIFKENPEHKFELTFIDVLTLDSEQLEELGVKKEEFDQILKLIKDNTSKYGTVLSVYAIEIKCDEYGYTGETQIKIKMTDEMKKFNSFKMIYIDDENNFKAGDVVNLTVEGEYLVGR